MQQQAKKQVIKEADKEAISLLFFVGFSILFC